MRKRNHFRWDSSDELFPDFENALHEATLRGYSVVELARILGNSTSLNLYNIMRTAGLIRKLPAGRLPKVDIHPGLAAALVKCNLTFYRWANSHDLEPFAMAEALRSPANPKDAGSVAAHNAFRQDFLQLYCKVYQLPVETGRVGVGDQSTSLTDFRIIIEPDHENGRYRAYVPELANCVSFGKTHDEAYFALKSRYVLFRSIQKLRLLPDKQLMQETR
ncbi:MAG: type II toxin-antitoxin system HicB family antitoxin [Geobacter sp.]|nr:MAG: type II toxin-antitoxin system HicB family antitoxin [Geobacter sp.]